MPDSIIQVFPALEMSLEDLSARPHLPKGYSRQLLFADGTPPPPGIDTQVAAFWNESSLFVLFSGRYSGLRISSEGPPGRTPRLWETSDVFEFFVGRDPEQTGHYKEFQVAPDGRWLAAEVRLKEGRVEANEAQSSSFRCISIIDGEAKVWRSAMEIPWSDLGGFAGTGDLRGNFYRASGKFHGDELLAWRPTGYGDHCFHRPERFGTLKIVKT